MFPDETRKRQEMLSEHVFTLAEGMLDKEKNEHIRLIQKLMLIYQDGFKHSYSDFFPVVSKVFEEETKYSPDYLMGNLEIIRETLEVDFVSGENHYKDVYTQFTKLCDHLNLQVSEMIFFAKNNQLIREIVDNAAINEANLEELSSARVDMEETRNKLNEARASMDEASERAKSLQTELIAVLSIFAAIVLTFSGGFSFVGSVLTSISNVEHYEMLILCALLGGIIMFNTIFLMMYLVAKITDRNIYARCKTDNCTCSKKCKGIIRIRKRLPYVFYFNVFCIIGIAIDCFVWYLDIIGKI